MTTLNIHIGGEDAEYLDLSVQGRPVPGSEDYWDGNWLGCEISVAVGAFRGTFGEAIRSDELERFLPELVRLYSNLTGSANLEALDGWLNLRLEGDGRGHINVTCRLSDSSGYGSTLDFRLDLDQTHLPKIIRQIEAVLRVYPVIGRDPG